MAIVVSCRCGRKFQTKDEYAGRQAKCPGCGKMLTIPGPAEEEQAEPEEEYAAEPNGEPEDEGVSPAEEARRKRKAKAAQDARSRNLIAIGSVLLIVVAVVLWGLFGGATDSGSSKSPSTDSKETAAGKETPTKQPEAEPPPKELPPPPKGEMDEVERYIQWAVLTKDTCVKTNAVIFKPDDPRLKFDTVWRPITAAQEEVYKAKKGALASLVDAELGPPPSAATDPIEARMLMDPDLVGNGKFRPSIGERAILYVFLAPCKATMPDVIKKYGAPAGAPLASGNSKINFYGRIALVEVEDGKIHAVIRKQPKE
ncbi:MAG: hypothetical protein ABSE73_15275 [Planctomycetota bacterium]